MKETDLAWAAGFFDGEGYVGIGEKAAPNGKISYVLQVVVTQVVDNPILKLQELFGGSIRIRKKRAFGQHDQYAWLIYSKAAEDFLRAISPYSLVKSNQITVALNFRELGKTKFYTSPEMGVFKNDLINMKNSEKVAGHA